MLHSILIIGNTSKARLTTLKNLTQDSLDPNPDLLIIKPDTSIGIKDVRSLESFLSRKPYKKDRKLVIIKQANLLTLPAQNALLKTLEEPPANSLIILLANSQSQFIPTIISRCQVINSTFDIKPLNVAEQKQIFNEISKASLGERINLASTHAKNKQLALSFVENQLLFLKPQIKKHLNLAKKMLEIQKKLEANANPKLCLESLFFSYQKG